jgi:hypothetical protein
MKYLSSKIMILKRVVNAEFGISANSSKASINKEKTMRS